jgi:hypothetical protein
LGRLLRKRSQEEMGQYRFDRIEQVVVPHIHRLLRSSERTIYGSSTSPWVRRWMTTATCRASEEVRRKRPKHCVEPSA